MGYGVSAGKVIVPFRANQTLSAYRVVKASGAGQVDYWDTSTANIVGVTEQDSQGGNTSSVAVVISGMCKVMCAASVSAGALVAPQGATNAAAIVEALKLNNTASAVVPSILGVAMQSGSTNSVISVLLQISNVNKIAY